MKTSEVFGISPEVRKHSYVDRGNLDETMSKMLGRTTHIAIRGPSKSGKSWLRQKALIEPITVQCRLRKPFTDIYIDALSQLDIAATVKECRQGVFRANISAKGEGAVALLGRVGLSGSIGKDVSSSTESKVIGHDIDDLRFVAEIIRASGRRLVIEDFHYMSTEDRRGFAFDLKALWDYQVFVVIIGVWTETNLLLHLNPDLTGRVTEIPIDWSPADLGLILANGGSVLRIDFHKHVLDRVISLSYANAGLLPISRLSLLRSCTMKTMSFRVSPWGSVNPSPTGDGKVGRG